ncbi:hypothetical protein [Pantoea sp. 18069]|uniref:hypothetical protein n=1 Tax=Pantoea sp. 18069 TaxID=2681415 RepID=UPI00135B1E31|nr:hypothetical protein [Pantoea sp. 18069]
MVELQIHAALLNRFSQLDYPVVHERPDSENSTANRHIQPRFLNKHQALTLNRALVVHDRITTVW